MDIRKKLVTAVSLILLLFCLMLSVGWLMNGLGYTHFDLPVVVNTLQIVREFLEFLLNTGGA